MKKLLLFIVAPFWIAFSSQSAFASFTSVNKGSTSAAGSATTIAIAVTGIHAGDLIFCVAGDGDGTQTITGISDGTTSFTLLTGLLDVAMYIRGSYLLSSVASGTVTYTATFAAAATNRFIGAWAFTPSAAASVDTDNRATGTDSATNSGNITTTGSDELVFGADINAAAVHTSPLIGGSAATAQDSDGIGSFWYLATTGTNIAASCTSTGSGHYVAVIASFKIGASSYKPQSLTTLGAGGE